MDSPPYHGRKLHVRVLKRPNFKGELRYGSAAAAGLDLPASIDQPITIPPGQMRVIPTGVSIEIPTGYEAQVRCRSGLAKYHMIGMLNGVGTIDADFRGEICALLINYGFDPFDVLPGDRICQLVFNEILRAEIEEATSLGFSERNESGFGSTGF